MLDLIAEPGQRPEDVGNDGADQDDELAERPQQRSDDRGGLAGSGELAAGLADAVVESRQEPGGPAHAEAFQSAAMQQEKRDNGECEEEQAGVEALGR